jgi:uncharacterized protein (TIGR02172 family)
MTKGKLIGTGRTAEVYEWGTDKVIKLFYDWYNESWIKRDADTDELVFKAGMPCPEVFGIVEDEGRRGIVYQRIEGRTMLSIAGKDLRKMLSCGKDLARLHYKMHRVPVEGFADQKEKLEYNITHAKQLSADKKERIIQYIKDLPNGRSVCHGDFHPDNILQTTKGSIVIDWSTVTSGDPYSDVARTCLILMSPYLPPDMPKATVMLIKMVRKKILSSYFKHYMKLSKAKKKDIDAWILPHAAARLREGVINEETWLLGLIDQQINR